MIVSRQDLKKAKVILYNLIINRQIYDSEKAKVIEDAVKILAEEIDRRREPRLTAGGRAESNRRRR